MGGNDLLKSPRKDRGSIKRTLPAKSKGMLPLLWRLEFGYGAGLDGGEDPPRSNSDGSVLVIQIS